jgi:hypothetical protein
MKKFIYSFIVLFFSVNLFGWNIGQVETNTGDRIFTRDNVNNIVTDSDTGLMWTDDTTVATQQAWNANYCSGVSLGGYNDWRLPNIKEFETIIDFESTTAPHVYDEFVNDGSQSYFTSTDIPGESTDLGYHMNTGGKNIHTEWRTYSRPYRCVRGTVETSSSFTRDATSETVTDSTTGLVWQDNADTQTDTNWDDAVIYCENLTQAGLDNWRIPTINELISIYDYSLTDPKIDTTFTNRSAIKLMWSNNIDSVTTTNAHYISFNGSTGTTAKTTTADYTVRCVSTPPTPKLTLKAHGGALQFSANNNSTFVSDINSSLSSASLEFWINTKHETNTAHSIGGIYGDNNQTIELSIIDGRINYTASNGVDTKIIYGSNIVNDGSWHHVALVFDNNILSNVYLDGVDDFADSTGTDPSAFMLNNPQLKFETNNLIDMSIDEVRIWNIARTQVDIKETINQQLYGNETGLLAYYNFDERIGDTVKDITGNGYDSIIDGNITRLNFLGDSLEFNSSSNNNVATSSVVTTQVDNISMAVWFKWDGSTISGDTEVIFNNGSSDPYWYGIHLWNDNGMVRPAIWIGGSGGISDSNLLVQANTWNHIVVTRNNGTWEMYYNGVKSTLDTGLDITTTPNEPSGVTSIGDFPGLSVGIGGNIAEASMWNEALSEDNVKQYMYSALKGDESGLVGYWPLNDGNGSTTAKDYSTNSNDGIISGATWVDTAPTIYGDTIYLQSGVNSWEKVVTQNVDTPAFVQQTSSNNILHFNPATGLFLYSSSSSNDSFVILETSESLSLNVSSQSIVSAAPSWVSITLNLSNLNLNEHNITNIFLVDANNFTGDINSTNAIGVADAATQLAQGTTTFTESTTFTNYIVVFETDMGTQDQMWWFYNFTDGELYSLYNFSMANTSEFVSNSSSHDINLLTWVDTTPTGGNGTISTGDINTSTNTKGYYIPEMNFKIDASEYENATPLSLSDNNIDSFYFFETYLDYNQTQVVRLEKILFGDTKVHSVNIKLYQNNPVIQDIEYSRDNYDSTSNIVTITENDQVVAQSKLHSILDNSELNTLYTDNTDLDNINFPVDAKGYEYYDKQITDECYVWSDYYITDLNLSSKEALLNKLTMNISNYNVIDYNRYDTSKGLVFDTDDTNNIYEVDFINLTSAVVGTFEELESQQCIDESNEDISFTSSSVIRFDINVDGYENRALIKNANGIYSKGEYIKTGYTGKSYGLNQAAKTYLAQTVGLNTTPLLPYPLEYDWNYVSLPTNTTLCIDAYKSELTDICNQNFRIEDVFQEQNLTVFKYSGNSWSHFTTDSSKIYNMDKLSSISQKDGLLIYSPYKTTIKLPFILDNFNFSSFDIYEKGWHLVGNQFKRSGSKIADIVTNQDFSLKYILNQTKDTNETAPSWKVYAPLNDNDVDSSLKRIEYVQPMDAFWIYVE